MNCTWLVCVHGCIALPCTALHCWKGAQEVLRMQRMRRHGTRRSNGSCPAPAACMASQHLGGRDVMHALTFLHSAVAHAGAQVGSTCAWHSTCARIGLYLSCKQVRKLSVACRTRMVCWRQLEWGMRALGAAEALHMWWVWGFGGMVTVSHAACATSIRSRIPAHPSSALLWVHGS